MDREKRFNLEKNIDKGGDLTNARIGNKLKLDLLDRADELLDTLQRLDDSSLLLLEEVRSGKWIKE